MNSTLCFESSTTTAECLGLLENLVVAPPSTNLPIPSQEIVLTIDLSTSMMDKINPNETTKIDNVQTMLENMIHYLTTHPMHTNVYISIFGFNDRFFPIVKHCHLTPDKLAEMVQKLHDVQAFGLTDIQLALTELGKKVTQWATRYPHRKFHSLFMTDGQATRGWKTSEALLPLVVQHANVKNVFLGFGVEHDFQCLHTLANQTKSEYYFIDRSAAVGMIYGEIMHGIFFTMGQHVRLKAHQGVLYDYKTNEWRESLDVHDLMYETSKLYYVKSSTPEECRITLEYDCLHTNAHHTSIICPRTSVLEEKEKEKEKEVLKKYTYRLRTLQLLYDVHSNTNTNIQTLQTFLAELMTAMREHHWEEDALMKMLCDDVSIAIKTLHSSFGKMYACARQTSQGCQRGYTVSFVPEYPRPRHRGIQRQITMADETMFDEDFEQQEQQEQERMQEWLLHLPSPLSPSKVLSTFVPDYEDCQNNITPYASSQCTQIMYELSNNKP